MAAVGKRGSISIEFILLLTISLVYIYSTAWPSIDIASESAFDLKTVSDAKISASKLADAINYGAAIDGEMRRTINVFLPKRENLLTSEQGDLLESEITCNQDDSRIEYRVQVSPVGFNPMEAANGVGCTPVQNAVGIAYYDCISYVELVPDAASWLQDCPEMDREFGRLVVSKTVPPSGNPVIEVNWEI